MRIETKFELGQTVHHIRKSRKAIRIPCPDCGGVSEMTTPAGGKLICRKCDMATYHGHKKGTVGSYEESAWHRDGVGTIGRVTVERYDYNGGDPDSQFVNYKPPKPNSDKETYMMWETGVGSGTLHSADDLFATKEEAQAECGRRNEVDDGDT